MENVNDRWHVYTSRAVQPSSSSMPYSVTGLKAEVGRGVWDFLLLSSILEREVAHDTCR